MVTSSPPLAAATATPSQRAVPAQLGKRTGPSHRPMHSRRMKKPFWRLSRPDFRAETSHCKIFGRATSGWDFHRLGQRPGHIGIPLRPPSTSGLATRMEPFLGFFRLKIDGVFRVKFLHTLLAHYMGRLCSSYKSVMGSLQNNFQFEHSRLSGCLLLMERDRSYPALPQVGRRDRGSTARSGRQAADAVSFGHKPNSCGHAPSKTFWRAPSDTTVKRFDVQALKRRSPCGQGRLPRPRF